MPEKIVCISAHPDDIELGMGGTLSLLSEDGNDIYVIINYIPGIKEERIVEIYNSMDIYNIPKENVIINDFYVKDKRERVKCIDTYLKSIKPDKVFTHYYGDTHQEHRDIFDIVNICCRRLDTSLFVWENNVIGGILVETFSPNYFVKLNKKHMKDKVNSWLCHKSQTKKYVKLDNIIYKQAELWGFKCFSDYAEAFKAIRIIS